MKTPQRFKRVFVLPAKKRNRHYGLFLLAVIGYFLSEGLLLIVLLTVKLGLIAAVCTAVARRTGIAVTLPRRIRTAIAFVFVAAALIVAMKLDNFAFLAIIAVTGTENTEAFRCKPGRNVTAKNSLLIRIGVFDQMDQSDINGLSPAGPAVSHKMLRIIAVEKKIEGHFMLFVHIFLAKNFPNKLITDDGDQLDRDSILVIDVDHLGVLNGAGGDENGVNKLTAVNEAGLIPVDPHLFLVIPCVALLLAASIPLPIDRGSRLGILIVLLLIESHN